MSIVKVILVLLAVGIVMWAINTYVPLSNGIKKLLNIVVILAVIYWLIKITGLLHYLQTITI